MKLKKKKKEAKSLFLVVQPPASGTHRKWSQSVLEIKSIGAELQQCRYTVRQIASIPSSAGWCTVTHTCTNTQLLWSLLLCQKTQCENEHGNAPVCLYSPPPWLTNFNAAPCGIVSCNRFSSFHMTESFHHQHESVYVRKAIYLNHTGVTKHILCPTEFNLICLNFILTWKKT